MPGPTAPKVTISEDERQGLSSLIRAHKTPQHFSFRAHIIQRLANGENTREVADHLRTTRHTVRRWRQHWLERSERPAVERLQDAPRPGAPATFSTEQWCLIMAIACEPPRGLGSPHQPLDTSRNRR